MKIEDMKKIAEQLGYKFEVNADGTEERVVRPDGSVAIVVRRPPK